MAQALAVDQAQGQTASQANAAALLPMMGRARISLQSGRRQTLRENPHLIVLLIDLSPHLPVQVGPNPQAVQEGLRHPQVSPHHPFPRSPFRFLKGQ